MKQRMSFAKVCAVALWLTPPQQGSCLTVGMLTGGGRRCVRVRAECMVVKGWIDLSETGEFTSMPPACTRAGAFLESLGHSGQTVGAVLSVCVFLIATELSEPWLCVVWRQQCVGCRCRQLSPPLLSPHRAPHPR